MVGIQREINKLACSFSNTANLTAQVLAEINQEMKELQTSALQNRAATDFLLLKHHLGCQQFPGMCCFNITDYSNVIQQQIDEMKKEINKIQMDNFWPDLKNWFPWLTSLEGPIICILLLVIVPCIINYVLRFIGLQLNSVMYHLQY